MATSSSYSSSAESNETICKNELEARGELGNVQLYEECMYIQKQGDTIVGTLSCGILLVAVVIAVEFLIAIIKN